MTKRQRLALEQRAAQLAADATDGMMVLSRTERVGWDSHFNSYHGFPPFRTPRGQAQLAGWLAREIWMHELHKSRWP